ncbi:L,D-transpeptidase family protein [Candidatus Poriferisodalis sp.]|uniref:L,D-transpeptidase family protein n=1 Tax=Candidatus Poriferisodalis sp. TaxID=3101277 RepID=UPI003C6FF910
MAATAVGTTPAAAAPTIDALAYADAKEATWLPGDAETLLPGETLSAGAAISSPDGGYRLVLEPHGDLVLYDMTAWSAADAVEVFGGFRGDTAFIAGGIARSVWSAGASTAARPAELTLTMQRDGHLVLHDADPARAGPIWQTRTSEWAGASLSVVNTGAVVVGLGDERVIWTAGVSTPDVGLQGRRHVVYGRSAQRVWLLEADGTLLDTYPVSGKDSLPGPGRYAVFSKSLRSRSLDGSLTIEHMVRFARGPNGAAIGFHSIPRTLSDAPAQSIHELGEPRSGGCVRQQDSKARQLFEWVPVGTPVVVIE